MCRPEWQLPTVGTDLIGSVAPLLSGIEPPHPLEREAVPLAPQPARRHALDGQQHVRLEVDGMPDRQQIEFERRARRAGAILGQRVEDIRPRRGG